MSATKYLVQVQEVKHAFGVFGGGNRLLLLRLLGVNLLITWVFVTLDRLYLL